MTTVLLHEGSAAPKLEPPPRPRVRAVRGGNHGLNRVRHVMRTAVIVLILAVFGGLAISSLMSGATLMELNAQVDEVSAQLAEAQSEYDYLNTRMNDITSRASLQQVAEGELGLVKALSGKRCTVKRCYFHHMQAIWRFLSKSGCSGRYRSDDAFRWSVRSLMVLPLFPEDMIRTTFDEFEKMMNNTDADTRAVYHHFKTVRIDTFPPSLWCQNDHMSHTNKLSKFKAISKMRKMENGTGRCEGMECATDYISFETKYISSGISSISFGIPCIKPRFRLHPEFPFCLSLRDHMADFSSIRGQKQRLFFREFK